MWDGTAQQERICMISKASDRLLGVHVKKKKMARHPKVAEDYEASVRSDLARESISQRQHAFISVLIR